MESDVFRSAEAIVVREIAQRVIERIYERRRNLLVVFTGALIGAKDSLEQLAALRDRGYQMTLLFSDAAAGLLDVDKIERTLKPEGIHRGLSPVDAARLLRAFDVVVVPELSANSCAHIVGCMTDTAAQTAVVRALQYGKTVVAAVDGCCPDNPVRAGLGFKATPALRARMHQNLEDLRDFGAHLCACSGIADAVLAHAGVEPATQAAPAPRHAPAPAAPAAPADVAFTGRLLNAEFIRGLDAGTTVRVSPETIVSPLVYDVARTRAVSIDRQGR